MSRAVHLVHRILHLVFLHHGTESVASTCGLQNLPQLLPVLIAQPVCATTLLFHPRPRLHRCHLATERDLIGAIDEGFDEVQVRLVHSSGRGDVAPAGHQGVPVGRRYHKAMAIVIVFVVGGRVGVGCGLIGAVDHEGNVVTASRFEAVVCMVSNVQVLRREEGRAK